MVKNREINGMEEIGLVTPTTGHQHWYWFGSTRTWSYHSQYHGCWWPGNARYWLSLPWIFQVQHQKGLCLKFCNNSGHLAVYCHFETPPLPFLTQTTGRDRLRLTALTTNHHGGGANREFWKTLVYTSDAHVRWNPCDRWSFSYHDGISFDSEELS